MTTFNSTTNMCNSFMKCTEDVQPAASFFANSPSLVLGLRSSSFTATSSAVDSHTYLHSQKNISNFDHHLSSSSSHIHTKIKREPCQVSEVTTSNCYHSNKPNSELVSPSMPTTVKIEATSPNTTEMDLSPVNKKIPHDLTMDAPALHPPKDVNCFGLRAADMGAVASNCGNVFFTGAEMFSGANAEDLSNCVNRSAPTFWQYPNTFQIESLISMPPVELQYSRDNRGQLVFMPAAPALDPFQQPAFLWPPFVQQNAASTLQPHTNFLFPSISSQTSSQYQSYQGPLQLLGPNYLPTVASATTSTLCQQSQTTDHRFASITTGTKEIEKYQKFDTVRGEDWNIRCNILNKNSSEIHCTAIDKVKLFHESKFLEVPTDTNEDGSKPILRYGKSQILLQNTNTPAEFQNMPIFSSNFIAPQNSTSITQNVSVEACKSTCLSTMSYPETTKMQDADIQTDTPACSEDELTPEVCPPETLSFGDQTRKEPSTGATALSIRNAEASHTNLAEKDSAEPPEPQTMANEHCRQEIFKSPNPRVFEENCPVESPIALRNSDNIEGSLHKQTNNPLLEMSGLELLSNISTGSFVKADSMKPVCIKKEPYDIDVNNVPCEPENECKSQEKKTFDINSKCSHSCNESYGQNLKHTCIQNAEGSLGGLNLLCALAEQRIQEEVESNNYLNTAEKSISADKSRKHKRSKAKSGKKSHSKKNRKSKNKDKKEYVKPLWLKSKCDYMHEQRSALKRSDPNYRKFNKYSNPEDFFKTMESDMRLRLADITRQYRRKKRKLDEISKQERKNKKIRLAEYKFANISCKNPNFICLLDKIQSPLKMPSSSEASEIHHLVMHSKSTSERRVESRESNEGSCIEKEVNYSEFDIRSSQKSTTSQGSYCIDQQTCNPKLFSRSNKNLARSMLAEKCQIQTATLTKTQNQVSTEIDKELVLTSQHLYQKETRVLTDMGGLFYAGILKPLQPPDVYAVTLDGERGNKSHIMSREEILKDTILELAPKSILNVPPGTRLCAYWSQQYRCLYPGRVIQTEHSDADSDFVSVEFDDGDSGRIRLQNIRFLLSDYPIVEYNENPFNPHGKNKLQTVSKYASVKTINVKSNQEACPESLIRNVSPDLHINEPVKSCTLSEHEHKHKKHKKRKKHKKLRAESLTKLAATVHTDAAEETTIRHRENTPRKHKDRQKQNDESKKHKREVTQSCLPLSTTECPITPEPCDEKSNVNAPVEAPNEVKPKRKSETSGKGSKIAAFLPERQLWRWLGSSYRKVGTKGKARKQFYKSITRGKETITVGECAVFLSAGRPDRPYIGRIEAMWETMSSNKVVRVRWFYHPEETTGCPKLKYPNALFDSPHEDENDVQTISHRCEVIQFSVYIAKHESNAKHFQSIYNYNDTYYLSGYYNPRLQDLKLNPDIPIETDDSL